MRLRILRMRKPSPEESAAKELALRIRTAIKDRANSKAEKQFVRVTLNKILGLDMQAAWLFHGAGAGGSYRRSIEREISALKDEARKSFREAGVSEDRVYSLLILAQFADFKRWSMSDKQQMYEKFLQRAQDLRVEDLLTKL